MTGVRERARGECVAGPRSCCGALSFHDQGYVNDRHPRTSGLLCDCFWPPDYVYYERVCGPMVTLSASSGSAVLCVPGLVPVQLQRAARGCAGLRARADMFVIARECSANGSGCLNVYWGQCRHGAEQGQFQKAIVEAGFPHSSPPFTLILFPSWRVGHDGELTRGALLGA